MELLQALGIFAVVALQGRLSVVYYAKSPIGTVNILAMCCR